jgi:hypothetical protein
MCPEQFYVRDGIQFVRNKKFIETKYRTLHFLTVQYKIYFKSNNMDIVKGD